MKSRLKSMILAIAVFAIVIVSNIGFGSFDRVDAKPDKVTEAIQQAGQESKYPIRNRTTDIKRVPIPFFRKNYPAGLKYCVSQAYDLFFPIWNGGAKQLLEQKMREAIDGKYLERGDRIHDVNIKFRSLYIDNDVFSFDPSTNTGLMVNKVAKNINFKVTNSSNPTLMKELIFTGEFDMKIEVKFRMTNQSNVSDDRITVDSVQVVIDNSRLYSDVDIHDTTFAQVRNFWNVQSQNAAAQIRGNYSIKNLWAGYIQSALENTVPANILNRR